MALPALKAFGYSTWNLIHKHGSRCSNSYLQLDLCRAQNDCKSHKVVYRGLINKPLRRQRQLVELSAKATAGSATAAGTDTVCPSQKRSAGNWTGATAPSGPAAPSACTDNERAFQKYYSLSQSSPAPADQELPGFSQLSSSPRDLGSHFMGRLSAGANEPGSSGPAELRGAGKSSLDPLMSSNLAEPASNTGIPCRMGTSTAAKGSRSCSAVQTVSAKQPGTLML